MFKELAKKLEDRVTAITDQDYTPGTLSLEQILVGLSRIYDRGVALRLGAYGKGWLPRNTLPCPVISIGNIVAGGAGKTPMAVFLADRLRMMGRKPVVVSRGYKGDLGEGAALVGDGERVILDQRTAGDEPYMMACLKRFPVVVGKDRFTAGQLALNMLDVDTIVLDDGFQHIKLARDLDIVLMDFQRPLGNGRLLPAGRLRERPELCRARASCMIMTRCPEGGSAGHPSPADRMPELFSGLPLFSSRHRSVLAAWKGRGNPRLPDLAGRSAVLFSGIAGNHAFAESVRNQEIKVADHLEFRDHYRYKGADFLRVRQRAESLGADLILTTEKDWVKVDSTFDFQRDLGIMGIELVMEEPERFDRFLKDKIFR